MPSLVSDAGFIEELVCLLLAFPQLYRSRVCEIWKFRVYGLGQARYQLSV